MKVRQIVQYQYDTGARGLSTLLGIVEKAGEKTYTVRWESGIRNRVQRTNTLVKLTTDKELLQEAAKPFPEAFRGRAGFIESRINRITKTEISLYDADKAGLESDPENPWATVCEAHGSIMMFASKSAARYHMAVPEWCSTCAKTINGEPDEDES